MEKNLDLFNHVELDATFQKMADDYVVQIEDGKRVYPFPDALAFRLILMHNKSPATENQIDPVYYSELGQKLSERFEAMKTQDKEERTKKYLSKNSFSGTTPVHERVEKDDDPGNSYEAHRRYHGK